MSQPPAVLITGASRGIGLELLGYFLPHSQNVSRSNGFDITNEIDRSRIAEMSIDFDIFVNLAYSRDDSQSLLFEDVCRCWSQAKKRGLIVNVGSYATFFDISASPDYLDNKSKLQDVSHQWSHWLTGPELDFRITHLRPGMLDTEKSRAKPHWRGNGLKGDRLGEIIKYVYGLPQDIQVPDLVIETKIPKELGRND